MPEHIDMTGDFVSPGGFVFGVQGFHWGEQRPSAVTFFLDGTAKVFDQHGRPIKGTVKNNKPIYFDRCTHAQVIAALNDERVDWKTLTWAGWPQLPYAELKALGRALPWPFDSEHKPSSSLSTGAVCTCVMCSIRDPQLRKDALRLKHETDSAQEKEIQAATVE